MLHARVWEKKFKCCFSYNIVDGATFIWLNENEEYKICCKAFVSEKVPKVIYKNDTTWFSANLSQIRDTSLLKFFHNFHKNFQSGTWVNVGSSSSHVVASVCVGMWVGYVNKMISFFNGGMFNKKCLKNSFSRESSDDKPTWTGRREEVTTYFWVDFFSIFNFCPRTFFSGIVGLC